MWWLFENESQDTVAVLVDYGVIDKNIFLDSIYERRNLFQILAGTDDYSEIFKPIPPITKLDLNKMDNNLCPILGRAAIHYAAYEGHAEIVKLLIDAGVDPDVKDGRRWSPFKWALMGRWKNVIRVIFTIRIETQYE